ncbi:MAG: twin-arginine translocase TatA/TatE family subunit [Chloroflexi bacterium]|nr:twin-arginine translocase TatA/TatE family subunit [Chloroflexota bacterium]
MPFRLGPMELIIVLVIVLVIFGIGKLPEVGSALGNGIRQFRKGVGSGRQESTKSAEKVPTKSGS